MNEETIFPPANDPNFIRVLIMTPLGDAGIKAHIVRTNNNFDVTPDQKVPEELMSNIRMSVVDRGYTIKFLPHD